MSAAAARAPRQVVQATSARPTRGRSALRRDKRGLPIPHVHIVVRDTHACRLWDHYYNTLRDDLMYMTYHYQPNPPKKRVIRPLYDPNDPYTKHRVNPTAGGNRSFNQPPPPVTADNVITLERIQLHTTIKDSYGNRSSLLGPLMAFRALSGVSQGSGNQRGVEGVQLVRGKMNIQNWVRRGHPVGVKVDLTGPKMYDFLSTLVEFVLPRLRDFPGIVLSPPSQQLVLPHAASGVVSFGLPPQAMAFFPQIEVNLDAYPKMYGMHIHMITNAFGPGAQNQARALLSGFQVPFVRR